VPDSNIGREGLTPPEPEIEDRLVQAWQKAYFLAFNRGSPEITTEDLLVGLSDEFGKSLLDFFHNPDILSALVERVRSTQIRHFDYQDVSGESPQATAESCQPIGFVGLMRSQEFEGVMEAVIQEMDTPPAKRLSLAGFMRILARSSAAKRLSEEYNLHFL